ncbi:MAG: fibronectin type III domain-containing protein [Flavobacteriales bacterium]|nr:fibronectin type III domain-containing protein [Flavobacteriales bacterium]
MYANIKLDLFNMRPPALLALLNHVTTSLDGNPLFPAPTIPVSALRDLTNELRDSIVEATHGSLSARVYRDAKVVEVRSALRRTSDYVRMESAGDAAKLCSSGFSLRKVPSPINEVDAPKGLVAKPTSSTGEVKLRWGRTHGARIFRVERCEVDPTTGDVTWTTIGTVSRQSFTAVDLVPYAPYWFRVFAFGKDNEGLPSNVALGRAA